MHVVAAMLVAQHLDQLQREADAQRRAKLLSDGRPSPDGSLRTLLAGLLRWAAERLDGGQPAISSDARPAAA